VLVCDGVIYLEASVGLARGYFLSNRPCMMCFVPADQKFGGSAGGEHSRDVFPLARGSLCSAFEEAYTVRGLYGAMVI
jgi:hypothetical protein